MEIFGLLPFKEDIRDYKLSLDKSISFPEKFELDNIEVKSQGSVGSCVAHSLSEINEYFNIRQEHNKKSMSTGFIYGNRRNSLSKSSGMHIREALSNLCKYGNVYEEDFKENVEVPDAVNLFEERFDSLKDKAYPNRITSYFRLYSDDDIKYTLMNYGPVVFGINWYENSFVDKNYILHIDSSKKLEGGHCMIIYGWNKDGWLIQNSWGKNWGNDGRAILPYSVKKIQAWGITDNINSENSDISKTNYNTTFKRFIAKIINKIINLFRKK